jgi:uncharacterized protein
MVSRFDRDPKASGPVVQGFTQQGFSVDGGVYEGLLLTPRRAEEWRAPELADLTIGDLDLVLSLEPEPEFLLLGTGSAMVFPPRPLVRALEQRGFGIEVMDSRAAARTWGMLRSEERWIAAALMPLGRAPH